MLQLTIHVTGASGTGKSRFINHFTSGHVFYRRSPDSPDEIARLTLVEVTPDSPVPADTRYVIHIDNVLGFNAPMPPGAFVVRCLNMETHPGSTLCGPVAHVIAKALALSTTTTTTTAVEVSLMPKNIPTLTLSVLGTPGCGKTSWINRLTTGEFTTTTQVSPMQIFHYRVEGSTDQQTKSVLIKFVEGQEPTEANTSCIVMYDPTKGLAEEYRAMAIVESLPCKEHVVLVPTRCLGMRKLDQMAERRRQPTPDFRPIDHFPNWANIIAVDAKTCENIEGPILNVLARWNSAEGRPVVLVEAPAVPPPEATAAPTEDLRAIVADLGRRVADLEARLGVGA